MDPISRTAIPLRGRAVAAQRWTQLTFLHWRVDPVEVAPLLPDGVVADRFDGSSWVGLIPFRLSRASLLGGPAVPYLGDFVEVNVRLYGVDEDGHRVVVFRSLEASRLAAVLAARAAFALPYFWSRTAMRRAEDRVDYRSRRIGGGPAAAITATVGEPVATDPLADFLTARWGMSTRSFGRTRHLANEHEPWRLRAATLERLDETLLAAAGIRSVGDREPDSVLFADGVTTRFGRTAPSRGR